MDGQDWDGISDGAKDLVSNLLQVDPKVRYSATRALKHKWLESASSADKPTKKVEKKLKKNIMMYKNSSKLKKIALNVSPIKPDSF